MRRRDLLTGLLATTTSSALPTAGLSMPPINDETNALATMTPVPSASWLAAADTLISSLKTAGVWQTLDLFYCLAAPSSTACTYNWVNMTSGRLTANGKLTYSANACVASDGSTGYFSTTFDVNSSKAQDGDAEYGFFTLNECTTDNISPFQTTGGKHYMALQANNAGAAIANLSAALNTSTAASFSSLWGSTVGHWVIQQNDTTAQLQAFVDGSSLGTSAQTHSADSGAVQLFRSASGSFTTRQVAFVHYGSKLTAPQQLALSKALYTFLTAIGVRPMAGTPGLNTGPTNVAPYKHCATFSGTDYPISPSLPAPAGSFQGRAGAYPYAMIKVNDPNYNSIIRLEAHARDRPSFDRTTITRVQINTANLVAIPWQTTCDFAFSFFIENETVFDTGFCDLANLHDQTRGVNCGPTHAIDPATGNFLVWYFVNGIHYNIYPVVTSAACAKGVWHHVRTTYRLDNSPNGFCQAWFDGVQVLNATGIQFGASTGAPFWWNITGLYQGVTGAGPTAVWYANLEFDISGTQPFASRIFSPLPVPPLT